MAKKESDRLRDEEREVETEAAFAGEGAESAEDDYTIPPLEKIDDIRRIEAAAKEAEGPGGASGPGISGGSETELY